MLKKIAHISDLHFGAVDRKIEESIVSDIRDINPDLLIVSGDLTQRARRNQFINAKEFLERFSCRKIIVPGNHDIPLFNIFMRFLFPLTNYKNIITDDLFPFYQDDTIAVLGINSARSFSWKSGRISEEQIEYLKKKLCPVDNNIFKIIVTHHPFIPPPGNLGIRLVGRSSKALHIIDKCYIDLLLAGHLHLGYSGDVRPFYPSQNSSIISAQAGTAISNRIRKERNAYNFIQANKEEIFITIREWDGSTFKETALTHYFKSGNEWVRK